MITVGEIARAVGATVIGDEEVTIIGVASLASAGGKDLVFVENQKHLHEALASAAAAVIAGTLTGEVQTHKPLLLCRHPRLAFARAAALLIEQAGAARHEERREGRIDPTAVVLPTASIGQAVTIDPWTFVGDGAVVGMRTWIGAGCVVGSSVVIGEGCRVYPKVTIYPGTRLGSHVTVHAGAVLGSDGFGYVREPESGRYERFPQVGRLEIEDDVEIGANTTIDRGALDVTRIGRGTKIDNLVHIGHNCVVGENVIIAAQAGFSGSIVIEDNVIIGGQVGVGEHARIQEGVMLGGQAGVLPKKILRGKSVAFWGTPAKPLREYLKSLAVLARLGKRE